MRALLTLWLCFVAVGCAPPDESCLVRAVTEGEAAQRVADGGVILGSASECGSGLCVRDGTVAAGPAAAAGLGYCASPCAPGCPAATACAQVGSTWVCLRAPP